MFNINYKLYKIPDKSYTAEQQVLWNRGIPLEEQHRWLHAWKDDINSWQLLDHIEEAAEIVHEAADKEWPTVIIQDCDVDGYTSASILYNYLAKARPTYTQHCVTILQHQGKQHGLSDMMEEIPSDTKMVILPDAGTNDVEECKELCEAGIKVVILDHHESDKNNPYATIVNPQLDNYPNKSLVGAGVTWQFCRACDYLYDHNDLAWNYVDLCALGQIGDMSDYRETEVRAIVNYGLTFMQHHFIDAIIEKNRYSFTKMNGVNYYSMAFYCVPFLNAVCRSGTQEEKKLVLQALLEITQWEKVESSKRGEKGKSIPCFREAVTVIERVKRRQTKAQDEAMDYFENQIVDNDLTKNAMIFLIDRDEVVPAEIRGLIANKIQAKYQHPTAVLSPQPDGTYSGSMRNYSLSVNQDLKTSLESTKLVHCAGHKNAAGLSVNAAQLGDLNQAMNDIYKNIDQTPTYHIDYLWNWENIDAARALDLGNLNIYGQNIPESLVCVEKAPLKQCTVVLMGVEKGHPTLKININGVDVIKFKSSQEEYEQFSNPNAYLTLVGKCKINEWQGKVSPQILVEDFELTIQETDWTDDWVF